MQAAAVTWQLVRSARMMVWNACILIYRGCLSREELRQADVLEETVTPGFYQSGHAGCESWTLHDCIFFFFFCRLKNDIAIESVSYDTQGTFQNKSCATLHQLNQTGCCSFIVLEFLLNLCVKGLEITGKCSGAAEAGQRDHRVLRRVISCGVLMLHHTTWNLPLDK